MQTHCHFPCINWPLEHVLMHHILLRNGNRRAVETEGKEGRERSDYNLVSLCPIRLIVFVLDATCQCASDTPSYSLVHPPVVPLQALVLPI